MKKFLFPVCVALAIYGCNGLIAGNYGDLPPFGEDFIYGSCYYGSYCKGDVIEKECYGTFDLNPSCSYYSSSSSRYSSSSIAIVYGTPVTYHDETYPTVVIGNQTWFAKNLNYNVEGSVCYNNQTSNCDTYGRLYNWETALTVCPTGWHLPTQTEWNMLTSFIQTYKGCSSCDTKHLKSTSGWDRGNGLDSYGFAALPGGFGNSDGDFYNVGYNGFWWSASERSAGYAYNRLMNYNYEYVIWSYSSKTSLQSVRCVKD